MMSITQGLLGNGGLFPGTSGATVGARVDGSVLILTNEFGSEISVDLAPATAATDLRVSSGAYNATTEAIDLTLSDASVISIPVASLLPVQTDATLDGDGSTTNLSIAISSDAGQIIALGTDGKILATQAIQDPSTDAGNLLTKGSDNLHHLARESVLEFSKIAPAGVTAVSGERILMQATANAGMPTTPAQDDQILIAAADGATVTVVPAPGNSVNGNIVSFTIQPGETFLFVFTVLDWKAYPRGSKNARFMNLTLAP